MEQRNSIDILDLAKFIMAIMVVGIHTLGKYGIYPLFRIAVPLFFMISSYLFFRKPENRKESSFLKKFCERNIKLYIFWFVVLLPVFIPLGGYLEGNIAFNIFKLGIRCLFGSTFPASWYIVALVIDISIIFFLQKNNIIKFRYILLASFCVYVVCCLNSNYRNLFLDNSIVVLVNKIYPGTIYNGFLVGLLWISLGYLFACEETKYNRNKSIVGLGVSFVLLLIEHYLVTQYYWTIENDCYFMLIPTCYFLFASLINCKWKSEKLNTKLLRKISTIMYCVHGALVSLVEEWWITGAQVRDCVLKFIVVLFFCMLIAYVICILEKKKKLKWLCYAY